MDLCYYHGLYQEGSLLYVEAESGEDSWKLEPIVNLLKEGAVGVIPTDTVYFTLASFVYFHLLRFLLLLLWLPLKLKFDT